MSSKPQVLLNNPQANFFEDDHEEASTESADHHNSQMGFFSFPPFEPPNFSTSNNIIHNINLSFLPLKPSHSHDFAPQQHLLSLQTSSPNLWASWGEKLMNGKRSNNEYLHELGVSRMKMKKILKGRRNVRVPRFSFKTMSDVDVLDDGYKWRKYGQKVVKNTQHPRSYYRCTEEQCRVKKRVERLGEDPRMVITTYEGRHVHSPYHHSQISQSQSHLNNFFW